MPLASQRLEYLPALTGLRGVAAGLVLGFHAWGYAGRPRLDLGDEGLSYPLHALAGIGFLGVDLFFVLSAFLLSQPFLAAAVGRRPWPDLRTFYVRRMRRVLPAFWAQLALLVAIGWVIGGAPPFDLRSVVSHALFLQFMVPGVSQINAVYWSLPVEWWFYFTLPVIGWAFGRARWWLLLLLVVVAAATFRLACWHWLHEGQRHPWANYESIMHLRARLDQFLIGIVAAWFHLKVARDAPVRAACAVAGMLGLLLLAPSLAARGDLFVEVDYPYLLFHYPLVGALWALVVFGAAGQVRWIEAMLGNRVLRWIGLVSFSLYLWHYPVFKGFHDAGIYPRLGVALASLLALVASLLLAWLSYRFIERPFLRDRN
jgi:peptidoglycan/LPS O-acetylase OafA/YrhL